MTRAAARSLARALALAALSLAVGAGLGLVLAREPAPPPGRDGGGPPKPRPAGPAERALLAPLTEGSPLGGFEVREIHAVSAEGLLRVICVQGRAVVRLNVALAAPADDGPAPPAVAGRYAIFYSLKNASPEEGERLAVELSTVLKANAAAPAPPGLSPFTPKPREPTPI